MKGNIKIKLKLISISKYNELIIGLTLQELNSSAIAI